MRIPGASLRGVTFSLMSGTTESRGTSELKRNAPSCIYRYLFNLSDAAAGAIYARGIPRKNAEIRVVVVVDEGEDARV